jgi:hypothetical protein
MWLSTFSQRLRNYAVAERKYSVNVGVQVDNHQVNITINNIVGRSKRQAHQKALDIVHGSTLFKVVGSKVTQKRKRFEKFV